MVPLLLAFAALVGLASGAPFDATRVTAAPWGDGAPMAAPVRGAPREVGPAYVATGAFAAEVLSPFGALVPVAGDPTGDDSELRAVHVGFNGTKNVLGVGCVGLAYAVSIAEGTAPRFGCPVDAATAARFGVPAGTNLEFEVPTGRLQSLRLPTGASLDVGALRCRGEVTFFEGVLYRCELARGHTLSGVALPAGTRTRFTTKGHLREATIPGRTVWAAGRTWGPEYTPCGVLYLWFEDDGTMVPPEPDPSGETCCL